MSDPVVVRKREEGRRDCYLIRKKCMTAGVRREIEAVLYYLSWCINLNACPDPYWSERDERFASKRSIWFAGGWQKEEKSQQQSVHRE